MIYERNNSYMGRIQVLDTSCFEDEEEFRYWWLPERASDGRILREARLSDKEKERFQIVYETKNTITYAGKQAVLTFLSSSSAIPPFAGYLAIGAGYTPSVDPGDNTINGEIGRFVPAGFTIIGNYTNIATYLGSGVLNTTFTNVGFYGGSSVSSTPGSGTLYSHAPFNYAKSGLGITIGYLIEQV
ncbi:MAG TPA: hypothetical protein VH593_00225 [Ktedonobacteraceae bacterium]|jgi:hypothetical protein